MKNFLLKSFAAAVAAIIAATGCTTAERPLLSGKIDVNEPTLITVAYDCNGECVSEDIVTDANGEFTFDSDLECDNADLVIYVGTDVYGAFVERGHSVRMTIEGGNATFTGDNVDRCNFNHIYNSRMSPWLFKPSHDHGFDAAEWRAMLQNGCDEIAAALSAVADSEAREGYARIVDARRKYYEILILQMEDTDEAEKQFHDAIAAIDPNADESRLSGLLAYWLMMSDDVRSATVTSSGWVDLYISQMAAVDNLLTNEANKRYLYHYMTDNFLMYRPAADDLAKFREGVAPYAEKAPRIIGKLDKQAELIANQITDGAAFPSDPVLIDRQGNKTTLAAVIGGKTAYIDFWATWCMPCCKEIPYMKELAAQYAGDDRIVFLSISIDDNVEAWKKKIDEDKPEWPNYIIDKVTGREFLDAMEINSIPRFIIAGRDGRIVSVKAERPSNKKTAGILNETMEQAM